MSAWACQLWNSLPPTFCDRSPSFSPNIFTFNSSVYNICLCSSHCFLLLIKALFWFWLTILIVLVMLIVCWVVFKMKYIIIMFYITDWLPLLLSLFIILCLQIFGIILWIVCWTDLFGSFSEMKEKFIPPIYFVTPLILGMTMVIIETFEITKYKMYNTNVHLTATLIGTLFSFKAVIM